MFVTVLTGALFGATAARFDDSWMLPAYLVLTGALVALAVIDFETYLLPNRIVYPLTVVMLALLALGTAADGDARRLPPRAPRRGHRVRDLLRAAPGLAAQHGLRRREALVHARPRPRRARMGRAGARPVPRVLLRRGHRDLILIATKVRGKSQAVPFGPFLAAGAITAVLIGAPILDWYKGT